MEEIKLKFLADINTGNTINLEKLSESKREQLMDLVKKANNSENKAWMPSKGENFYFVTSDGEIYCDYFGNGRGKDKEILELGNCFRTRKEAEEAVTRQKMLTKWKRLSVNAGENNNPWDGKSEHWYVYYSCGDNKLRYDHVCLGRSGDISFPTKESCMAAVKELGEENVKKYILNVKNEYN